MKEFNSSAEPTPVPPAAPNGIHHGPEKKAATPKHAAGSRRSAPRKSKQPEAQPSFDAPFAGMEMSPSSGSMWMLHSALWFQSERTPRIPDWTGLGIERHNGMPRPDLLPVAIQPPDRPAAPEKPSEGIGPEPHVHFPKSDLTPLGWDPRTVYRKENS
jgi:hypothetical protein